MELCNFWLRYPKNYEYGRNNDTSHVEHSEWQVSTHESFSNIIINGVLIQRVLETVTNVSQLNKTILSLPRNSVCYVRTRDKLKNLSFDYTAWSVPVMVSTSLLRPVINLTYFVEDNTYALNLSTQIANNSSEYNYTTEQHTSTQWQVSTDNTFNVSSIIYNETSNTNLLVNSVSNIPLGNIVYARCRQIFSDGNVTQWSFAKSIDLAETYSIPQFDADFIKIQYIFNTGDDIDTRTRVLTQLATNYVGWGWISYGSDDDGIIYFAGDNTGQGTETAYIDLNRFKELYPLEDNIKIDIRAQWYDQVGTDPISVKINLYKGGAMVDDYNYDYTNDTATDSLEVSFNSLVLDTYNPLDYSIGRRIGVLNYNVRTSSGYFDPLDATLYGDQTEQAPGVSYIANADGTDLTSMKLLSNTVTTIVTTDVTRYVTYNDAYTGLTSKITPVDLYNDTISYPDIDTLFNIEVPWSISFLGRSHGQLQVSDNAYITFDDTSLYGTEYTEINNPFFDKIVLTGGNEGSCRLIQYEIQGSAPNRTLHVWIEGYILETGYTEDPRDLEKHTGETDLANITPTLDYEIRLHENTINRIDILMKNNESSYVSSDYLAWKEWYNL